MGTFTFSSGHLEPGLLVVDPSTGETVFWETVANSSILGLVKQRERGLHNLIPGLLSGESVIELVSIEPAGTILIMSTGRLCHVSVRDSQGKSAVKFQLLNTSSRATSGGLLEGLISAFSSTSWRRNIVAARAGRSYRRGQRAFVVATDSGLIEVWDVHWSSGGVLKTKVESATAIREALEVCNKSGEDYKRSYELVDFTFRKEPPINAQDPEIESTESLWVLVSANGENGISYFVVGVDIQDSELSVGRVYPIQNNRPLVERQRPQWSPRLYVPDPGSTGFVVFEGGVVLLSLMPFRESPSSQLLGDDDKFPVPFQDSITFRDGKNFQVVGCGLENAMVELKHPSCLVMLRNFGLLRISARPRFRSSNGTDEGQIDTKSRLEQVVFYGAESNPVDLACYEELSPQPAVFEDAAIKISNDILRSSSKYVPTTLPSLGEQMSLRSTALRALIAFINRRSVQLSYSARWTLLSHAEKLAAQMALWRTQGTILNESASGNSHLECILSQMGERFRTIPGAGENDLVRYWFTYDTWRMEYIVPWILHGIQDTVSDSIRLDRELIWQIWQASELSLAILETVFQFRKEHEELYGLEGHRPDENGPVMPNYSEISPLWSAEKVHFAETERLLDAQLNTCLQWMRKTGPKGRSADRDRTLIERIKQNGPRAFNALWQLYMERLHWCNSQPSADDQELGRTLQKSYSEHRKTQLYKMAAMGLLDDSIALAESFQDMDALVELIVELENQIRDRHPAGAGDPAYDTEMGAFQRRINKYFQEFGEAWATPFYTRQIVSGHAEFLLLPTPYRVYITQFLRARPGYAKLSWMNDILGENDYDSASKSLGHFAATSETNLWSKQVELAIGKLSKLATLEISEPPDLSNLQTDIRWFDDLSELARMQELLYEHVAPVIHGAIDQSAELQLANEQLGNVTVRSKPALREALRRGLAKLIAKCPIEPDELIDILTLMDPIGVTDGEDSGIGGHEFGMALKALKISDLSRRDPEYTEILEKIVWRRCMIRDDWATINSTKQKGDKEVESAIQSTALFRLLEDIESEYYPAPGPCCPSYVF